MLSRIVLARSSCAWLLLFARTVLAQPGSPPGATGLAADVVVSAEAGPEAARSLGAAATVIDSAEIAASKA
ncbi:MAG: hypothetical protein ACXVID_03860, partial [Thermoanaerobaculia bacterium]